MNARCETLSNDRDQTEGTVRGQALLTRTVSVTSGVSFALPFPDSTQPSILHLPGGGGRNGCR